MLKQRCATKNVVDQKYVSSIEMFCWERMEKISWSDRVRNGVLHRVKEERNIIHTTKIRKANWIGHNLCRNRFVKHTVEGKRKKGIRDGKTRKKALEAIK
jgi:hypothetical protein